MNCECKNIAKPNEAPVISPCILHFNWMQSKRTDVVLERDSLRKELLGYQHENGHMRDCSARKFRGVDEPIDPEWPMPCSDFCASGRAALNPQSKTEAERAIDKLGLDFKNAIERIAGTIARVRGSDKIELEDVLSAKDGFLEELRKGTLHGGT